MNLNQIQCKRGSNCLLKKICCTLKHPEHEDDERYSETKDISFNYEEVESESEESLDLDDKEKEEEEQKDIEEQSDDGEINERPQPKNYFYLDDEESEQEEQKYKGEQTDDEDINEKPKTKNIFFVNKNKINQRFGEQRNKEDSPYLHPANPTKNQPLKDYKYRDQWNETNCTFKLPTESMSKKTSSKISQGIKEEIDCIFGNKCTKEGCKFNHSFNSRKMKQQILNQLSTQKQIGKENEQRFPCRFSEECTNDQCPYSHSLSSRQQMEQIRAKKAEDSRKLILCRFGEACNKTGCPFFHPDSKLNQKTRDSKPVHQQQDIEERKSNINLCMYGANCQRRGTCPYQHPSEQLLAGNQWQQQSGRQIQIPESNWQNNKTNQFNTKKKPTFYLEQVEKQMIKGGVFDQMKCHQFDLFGKCDADSCIQNHNFKPLFECMYIKYKRHCNYLQFQIQNDQKNSQKQFFDCNNEAQNQKRRNCHEYTLYGTCSSTICKGIHREILKKCTNLDLKVCKICRDGQIEIKETIKQKEEFLSNKFKYNSKKLQSKLEKILRMFPSMKKNQQIKNGVDLMFIVECTSSMTPWIQFVYSKIENITNRIKNQFPNFTFRYSFVGYRDFKDNSRIVQLPFSKDQAKFIEFVKQIKAQGGDNVPQDMTSSLKCGLSQQFIGQFKMVYLFYDAPNHGLDYHDYNLYDDYPDIKVKLEDLIKKYAEKEIYFTQYMLHEVARKTFNAIHNEYINNEKSDYIKSIKHNDESSQQVESQIIQICLESITHTLSKNSKSSLNSLNHQIENPFIQNPLYNTPLEVKVLNQYICNMNFPFKWYNPYVIEEQSTFQYQINILKKLGSGSLREAFFGRDITLQKDIVIKFDKNIYNDTQKNWIAMIENQKAQVVSAYLINQFRQIALPYVSHIGNLPSYIERKIAWQGNLFCYLESHLKDFKKLSYNSFQSQKKKDECQKLLECLPHFSFQYTQGALMITDLQGSNRVLTDQCIHTSNQVGYGSTNQGNKGMAQFFLTHKCNDFCRKFKLIDLQIQNDIQKTKFKFDYYADIYQESEKYLLNLNTKQEICRYKNQEFFCQLCEQFGVKAGAVSEIKDFLRNNCQKCHEKIQKGFNKVHCIKCGCQFSRNDLWLQSKRGLISEQCPTCNKANNLDNIIKYYKVDISKLNQAEEIEEN